jgi:transposase InsO family protein
MCSVLKLPRATYYYESKRKVKKKDPITDHVIKIFKDSRNNYGTRKIKVELKKSEDKIIVSRRRIGHIMRENGLVSNYTVAQYKVHKQSVNNEIVANKVNREFDDRETLEVVVSDLTYVRVNGKWNYVCLILDLYNREIIGYSAGIKKDALLVYQAFASISYNLNDIKIFHTDRGSEFKNNVIEGVIDTFNIQRSLSKKGCPYDNAVAEATFKIFKTEFVYPNIFSSLDELKLELSDYVHWYNNIRIHSTLGYLTPVDFRKTDLKKVV